MIKYDWENKEQFLKDWSLCLRISDFLRNNNLTLTSGNYKTFKKWFEIHNDNLSESLSQGNFFTENSTISRVQLRKKIKKMGILKYECSKCLNSGEWNGKSLTLQLEHINGVSNDNRIENLEYLCPNCHSQTASYAGNNIRNIFLKQRVSDILKLKKDILDLDDINKLSITWKVKDITTIRWLNSNYLILAQKGVTFNKISKQKKTPKKTLSTNIKNNSLYISSEEKKQYLLNDINNVLTLDNPVQVLSLEWNIKRNSVRRKIKTLGLSKLHSDFQIKEKIVCNHLSRSEIVLSIVSKKDVGKKAMLMGISTNALKKWIKVNMKDKYQELYLKS